ncbi:MAG TPA: hypothetical protein H9875_00055 [Candidatus Levilactobacillus faecigallinarum]|uniref:Uncharacterized protein n=1 Tax=Candidatus Levilactobacillus faecigallinarum TaxID=2838638 RepID=A0A9D1U532_9LACO|nr:hypothetical protein [Candidatus Levilactobacillus faecigallinarum]
MTVNSAAGLSSSGTRLYYANHGDIGFIEVANVKSTPEMGMQPQQLETTNLGDETQHYDLGMNNTALLAFSIIYKGPEWNTIYAKSGNRQVYDWKIVYPDGMYITFSGPFVITLAGLDINTAAAYTLSISPADVPLFHKSDGTTVETGGGDDTMYRPMFTKTFASLAEMNAYDDAQGSIVQGDFVLIGGTSSDRGKVFFYNGKGFTYFASIIGPQGDKGDQGEPGANTRMMGKVDKLPALAQEGQCFFVGTELYSWTNGAWVDLGNFVGGKGDTGDKGATGDSAYQVAVAGGYTGTAEEWLASLKGDQGKTGATGDSAYQVAVTGGYTGTETEWLASLKGEKGDTGQTGAGLNLVGTVAAVADLPADQPDGTGYLVAGELYTSTGGKWTDAGRLQGADGKSAYQVAVDAGYVGTEAEWLKTLVGATGETGPTGSSAYELAVAGGYSGTQADWLASLKGARGDSGKSAYEVAVAGGYTGNEKDWLASLIGATGADGPSAYDVAVKNGFSGTEAEWLAGLKTGGDVIGGRNYALDSEQIYTIDATGITGETVHNWYLSSAFGNLKKGTQMHISFDIIVKNADSGVSWIGYSGKIPWIAFISGLSLKEGINHVSQSFIQPADGTESGTYIHMTVDNSKATYSVKNIMLEVGTIEHDTTPAPEEKVDIDSNYGAVNLIKNSGYMSDLQNWTLSTWDGKSIGVAPSNSLSLAKNDNYMSSFKNVFLLGNSNNKTKLLMKSDRFPVTAGKTYSVQMIAYRNTELQGADLNINVAATVDASPFTHITLADSLFMPEFPSVKRLIYTFVAPAGSMYADLQIGNKGGTDTAPGNICLTEIKVAQESVASPWSLSPIDLADSESSFKIKTVKVFNNTGTDVNALLAGLPFGVYNCYIQAASKNNPSNDSLRGLLQKTETGYGNGTFMSNMSLGKEQWNVIIQDGVGVSWQKMVSQDDLTSAINASLAAHGIK